MRKSLKAWIKHYSFYLGGDQPSVSWVERIRSVLGAFIGLTIIFVAAQWLREFTGISEWVMASLGASALLVFALPQSPMAQPWAVIAGNTFSVIVGISCVIFIPTPIVALPAAVSLSILVMFMLRCLHPPAAAVALIAVLGEITHYRYAFFPVMVDSVLLILAGGLYSNLTGKRYPNRPNKAH